ncbi:MAG: TolC family protein [bacterium]
MCKRVTSIVVSLLAFSSFLIQPTYAQNGHVLSLEECLKIANKNNSTLRNAIHQVDRAGASVMGSYSSILPSINTSFQSGKFIQGARTTSLDVPVGFDSTTGQATFEQTEITQPSASRNTNRASITYSQTLWDFGRSYNGIKQAKASFEAQSYNLTSARQNVYALVKQRYLELLKALKLEQEYVEAVERSKEQLNRTQSMYEIGSVAQVDVYKSEVTLATDEINQINQTNIVDIAKGNLNVAMGRDPNTPIDIKDLDVKINPPDFTLDNAVAIAQANNPDLRRFESDMKSAEYGMRFARGAYWPSLGFSLTYSRDNTAFSKVYGGLSKNWSVAFGAQLNLNLFNGLSDAAEVGRQSATYSMAKESWYEQKRNIALNVKQAYLNLQAFLKISKINERNLRSAEEDFRLAQERYRVGAGTVLEVTDAQVALTRARVVLVRTKYDAMIARAQLEAAMGTVSIE